MWSVLYIALMTVKEEIRNKVFHLILFILVVVVSFSLYLSKLSVSNPALAFGGFSLYFVKITAVLGVLSSMLFGLYAERENKTYHLFVVQSHYPFLYIVGRFLGYNLLLLLTTTVSIASVYLLELTLFEVDLWSLWMYALDIGVVFFMISGVALLFYTIFSTPIISLVLCIATFFVGHLSTSFYIFTSHYTATVSRLFSKVVYFLIPNLSLFSSELAILHDNTNGVSLSAFAYGLSYGLTMVAFASFVFCSWRDY